MTATITVIGNMTADAELRYSQSGVAIASFTVASTEKKFDKAANEWVDGKKLFMRCTAWREMAEHIAASLTKGTRVIAVGKLSTREWEDKDGGKRSGVELDIDAVGADLRYATAQVTKVSKDGRAPAAPSADTWATPAAQDETPF